METVGFILQAFIWAAETSNIYILSWYAMETFKMQWLIKLLFVGAHIYQEFWAVLNSLSFINYIFIFLEVGVKNMFKLP